MKATLLLSVCGIIVSVVLAMDAMPNRLMATKLESKAGEVVRAEMNKGQPVTPDEESSIPSARAGK